MKSEEKTIKKRKRRHCEETREKEMKKVIMIAAKTASFAELVGR